MLGGVGSRSNECGKRKRLKKVDKRKRSGKRASRRGKDSGKGEEERKEGERGAMRAGERWKSCERRERVWE